MAQNDNSIIMFKDREQAGELLSLKLKKVLGRGDFVVVSLLRGGIVLGKKISDYFRIPLFPLAVKKISAPLNPELGIGAVTFDGTSFLNESMIDDMNIPSDYIKTVLEERCKEAKLLQDKIEANTEKVSWKGKSAIVVDDGVATGNTAICASIYLEKQKVEEVFLATPVISKDRLSNIKGYFDKVIALKTVGDFGAVGEFYRYFPQVEDNEVIKLLSNW